MNEAKAAVKAGVEVAQKDEGTTTKVGHWNRRTVCAKLHSRRLKEFIKEVEQENRFAGSGKGSEADDMADGENGVENGLTESSTHIYNYQKALTRLWNSLSHIERMKCENEAKAWNSGSSPLEVQLRCEAFLYQHKTAIYPCSAASRATKHISKKAEAFLETLQKSMGAVALILVKYTNSHGAGSIGM